MNIWTDIMHELSDFPTSMSLRLSHVLGEIGVNEDMVMRRRQTWLEIQTMHTITEELCGTHFTQYYFGSQIEGTTTPAMKSDLDALSCQTISNVIQGWSEWEHGKCNLLLLKDECTPPGYGRLQQLRGDVPLPNEVLDDTMHVFDGSRRVLLKNTVIHDSVNPAIAGRRHGPSHTKYEHDDHRLDEDRVVAFPCRSWPEDAIPWLTRPRPGHWPTPEMIRYCVKSGCFLVPVGHRLSGEDECVEWRLSTSLAELCLMFSMNITQIRCYVVLKMIVKTFITPRVGESITSFHCKTTMFHCIENTPPDIWKKENLLLCIHMCLLQLREYVVEGYCPNFIITSENLFTGRISFSMQHQLKAELGKLVQSKCRFLLQIPIDDVGQRLQYCIGVSTYIPNVNQSDEKLLRINEFLCKNKHLHLSYAIAGLNGTYTLMQDAVSQLYHKIKRLFIIRRSENSFQRSVVNLIIPFLCSTLGSILASVCIQQQRELPQSVLAWLIQGINSDVSSGRLKLASAMYSNGDLINAAAVLQDVEERYAPYLVDAVCPCSTTALDETVVEEFIKRLYSTSSESQCKQCYSMCVIFLRCEVFCVPRELQFEMFRSIGDDRRYRTDLEDRWMDMAVVGSLHYLYYLQYMTYRQLGNHDRQYQALNNLASSIQCIPKLGHIDTALNLLGQCMQLENRLDAACDYYRRSLAIRPRNNAANWHMLILLSRLANTRQP